MGLFILEKGRALDAATTDGGGGTDIRRQQIEQIERLKHDSAMLYNNSSRMARQMVGGGDGDGGGYRGVGGVGGPGSEFTVWFDSLCSTLVLEYSVLILYDTVACAYHLIIIIATYFGPYP